MNELSQKITKALASVKSEVEQVRSESATKLANGGYFDSYDFGQLIEAQAKMEAWSHVDFLIGTGLEPDYAMKLVVEQYIEDLTERGVNGLSKSTSTVQNAMDETLLSRKVQIVRQWKRQVL